MATHNDSSEVWTSANSVKAGLGMWPVHVHAFTLTIADLTAAAVTEAVDIAESDAGVAFPTNVYILGCVAVVDEAFAGGTLSALTLEVGDTVDPNELLTASDAFGASPFDVFETGGATIPFDAREAAYAPECLVTATGDDVDNITAGIARIYITYFDMGVDPLAALP